MRDRLNGIGRGSRLTLLVILSLAGCSDSPGDLVREIDAARQGCTEEMLAEGAEECVQMFERYIEMGSEAVETYIGAVRALDEAVQRQPAMPFDTAGLGHAVTPGATSAAPEGVGSGWGRSATGTEWRAAEPREYDDGRIPDPERWQQPEPFSVDDPSPYPPARAEPRLRDRNPPPDGPPATWGPAETSGRRDPVAPEPPATGDRRRPAPDRGMLLPPEERLRRPWVGDESVPSRYYPRGAAPEDRDARP